MKKKNHAKILVHVNEVSKLLSVVVRGTKILDIFLRIIDIIEDFIDNFYELQREIYIECPHCINLCIEDKYQFEFSQCQTALINGKAVVNCSLIRPIPLDLVTPDLGMSFTQKINISELEINYNQKLGLGSFAIIYSGQYHQHPVAVKLLNSTQLLSENTTLIGELKREVWIMSAINHPNLVTLYGVCMSPLSLILELAQHGTLHDYLHSGRPIQMKTKWKLALDIAAGMNYLHKRQPPIVHRDLKSPNILLFDRAEEERAIEEEEKIHIRGRRESEDCLDLDLSETEEIQDEDRLIAKVSDFGLSRVSSTGSFLGRVVENPMWLAPEIIENKEYDEKSDVYSFGVILWEILTRQVFLSQFKHRFEIEDAICSGIRPVIPDSIPSELAELIQFCWDGDPKKRPPFQHIYDYLLNSFQSTFGPSSTLHGADQNVNSNNLQVIPETDSSLSSSSSQTLSNSQKNLSVDTLLPEKVRFLDKLSTPQELGKIRCMTLEQFNTNPFIWVGHSSGIISIWDIHGKCVHNIEAHEGAVLHLTSDDDVIYSTGSDKLTKIWNSMTRTMESEIKSASSVIACQVGENTVVGEDNGYLYIFVSESSHLRKVKLPVQDPVTYLLPTNNCTDLWVSAENAIIVYDSTLFRKKKVLTGHTDTIHCMLEYEEEVWTCSNDKSIRIWNQNTLECSHILHGHLSPITSLMRYEQLIYSCSWNLGVLGWDGKTKQFLFEFPVESISTMIISGSILWCGCNDDSIVIYSLNQGENESSNFIKLQTFEVMVSENETEEPKPKKLSRADKRKPMVVENSSEFEMALASQGLEYTPIVKLHKTHSSDDSLSPPSLKTTPSIDSLPSLTEDSSPKVRLRANRFSARPLSDFDSESEEDTNSKTLSGRFKAVQVNSLSSLEKTASSSNSKKTLERSHSIATSLNNDNPSKLVRSVTFAAKKPSLSHLSALTFRSVKGKKNVN